MNKLFFITILISSTQLCKAIDWYSTIEKKSLAISDELFYKKNTSNHKSFLNTLTQFKKIISERRTISFYGIRTKKYQETVPFQNFKDNIFNGKELPIRIYYSNDGSIIRHDKAKIKTYYVVSNGKFETCDETFDNWIFDKVKSQWCFVSNTLSWGSPVVLND